jgi:hypothetical protein
MQVLRIMWAIAIPAALDGSLDRELERDRNRALAPNELGRKLEARTD